jgi:translation initiation factor IF-3
MEKNIKDFNKKPTGDFTRVNHQIRAVQIRVINAEGEMLGLMTPQEGIRLAREAGVDLVEVSPNATPPVCKLINYGKFKYEQQKKKNEAKKNQKQQQLKEIKLRPNIDPHDLGIKMKQMVGFLEDGDKIKITVRFKGREIAHADIGAKLLDRVKVEFEAKAKIESPPRMEGKQMAMVIAPATAK